MKYKDLNGVEGEAKPGESFCGIGFTEVTLTMDDVLDERFLGWFAENVIPRMWSGNNG